MPMPTDEEMTILGVNEVIKEVEAIKEAQRLKELKGTLLICLLELFILLQIVEGTIDEVLDVRLAYLETGLRISTMIGRMLGCFAIWFGLLVILRFLHRMEWQDKWGWGSGGLGLCSAFSMIFPVLSP
ncbi:hypothetical protein ACJX0J_022041 [Zea mays]